MRKQELLNGLYIILAAALISAASVVAIRVSLDELHDHMNKIEVRLDKLEERMSSVEEREAITGIRCPKEEANP